MLKKINQLKAILDQELEKKDIKSKEILLLSKQIDELMVEYYLNQQECQKTGIKDKS